jgi:predicted aldo/keto reductase-like oxidoreductase
MAEQGISRRGFLGTGAAAIGAAGLAASGVMGADAPPEIPKERILNYNEKMEYRRWGKANLMISAICLGGHWKRLNTVVPSAFQGGNWLGVSTKNEEFLKNRTDVVTRCMEVGINHIDACTRAETIAYSAALKGRRDKMYLGYSWYEQEMRNGNFRTAEKLLKCLEDGMRDCGLDYVDLWRVTMHEQSHNHSNGEVEEMMKALETAKKQGKARFAGFSSHDRLHIKWMIETYPNIVDACVSPYHADSHVLPKDSLFETLGKTGVAMFGIKPFSSGSLFQGDSSPNSPHREEDDRRARLAIRYILSNPAITAPIPGLISAQQVDNVAAAIAERRAAGELKRAEADELKKAVDDSWAKLPPDYQWLKDWNYV